MGQSREWHILDMCQRAIGGKCYRKRRSSSIADLVVVEVELHRREDIHRRHQESIACPAVTLVKWRHNRHESACDWL